MCVRFVRYVRFVKLYNEYTASHIMFEVLNRSTNTVADRHHELQDQLVSSDVRQKPARQSYPRVTYLPDGTGWGQVVILAR